MQMSFVPQKCSLRHVLVHHPHLVITRMQIKRWEIRGTEELIQRVIDERNEELVLDGVLIQWPVINTKPPTSIKLPHKYHVWAKQRDSSYFISPPISTSHLLYLLLDFLFFNKTGSDMVIHSLLCWDRSEYDNRMVVEEEALGELETPLQIPPKVAEEHLAMVPSPSLYCQPSFAQHTPFNHIYRSG